MSGGWLLLRSRGLLWAVASSRVGRVGRTRHGVWVQVGDEVLSGDEIPAVRTALEISELRPLLRRLAPGGTAGVAVWRSQPLLVMDPERPPAALRRSEVGEEEA